MTKVFLDTNIWLRFLRQDDQTSTSCHHLIAYIAAAKIKGYTSTIVLLETHYVLTKFYGVSTQEVAKDLEKITKTTNLTLVEKTHFPQALSLHKQTNVKLADCLIATQLPPKATLVTFDKEFQKIPHLTAQTPHEFLSSLNAPVLP